MCCRSCCTDTIGYTRLPDGTLVARRTPTGGSCYYLTDPQDSTLALVDSAGARIASYAYDPYGATSASTTTPAATSPPPNDNPYRYTAGYLDSPTGLYNLGARYYDPTQGRFTQQDPTGQDSHCTYTGNNPINGTDLTGQLFVRSVHRGTGKAQTSAAGEPAGQ